MEVIMYNIKNKTLEYVDLDELMTRMYELKIKLPTIEQVEEYIKLHPKGDNITSFFIKNISNGIQKIKRIISKSINETRSIFVFSNPNLTGNVKAP